MPRHPPYALFSLSLIRFRICSLPEIKKLSFQSLFSYFCKTFTSILTSFSLDDFAICFLPAYYSLSLFFLLLVIFRFNVSLSLCSCQCAKISRDLRSLYCPQKGTAWLVYYITKPKSRIFHNFFKIFSQNQSNSHIYKFLSKSIRFFNADGKSEIFYAVTIVDEKRIKMI